MVTVPERVTETGCYSNETGTYYTPSTNLCNGARASCQIGEGRGEGVGGYISAADALMDGNDLAVALKVDRFFYLYSHPSE